MDRRQAERFPTRLPCYVFPIGMLRQYISAVCENLSRSGLLVRCTGSLDLAASLAVGDDIEVFVELPARPDGRRARSLRCAGTICALRAGPEGEPLIAATIQRMHFCELPPRFAHERPAAVSGEPYPVM